jgi:hypothetical protein
MVKVLVVYVVTISQDEPCFFVVVTGQTVVVVRVVMVSVVLLAGQDEVGFELVAGKEEVGFKLDDDELESLVELELRLEL